MRRWKKEKKSGKKNGTRREKASLSFILRPTKDLRWKGDTKKG